MKRQMNISYDGIGLVNNRGASKYWGVNSNNAPSSHTDWRLQLNVGTKTHTFYFDGCNPSEEVAASIISKFYDKRNTGIENVSYVKACDGVWYKVDPLSHKVRKLITGKGIPTGMIKELPIQFKTQGSLDFDQNEVKVATGARISQYEADIINKMIDGFQKGDLSQTGVKLMNRVLSIIEY